MKQLSEGWLVVGCVAGAIVLFTMCAIGRYQNKDRAYYTNPDFEYCSGYNC